MAPTLRRGGRQVHRMERSEVVDALTGKESVLWSCPICGRKERERDGGFTDVQIHGDAPTPDDVGQFAELAATPEGRLELSGILRSYPLHDRIWNGWPGVRLEFGP